MGPGSTKAAALSQQLGGAKAVWEAGPAALAETGIPTKHELALLCNKSLARAEAAVAKCDELGYRVMTLDDPDYPPLLRDIFAPPCALYLWGELPPADSVCIAVVGTRKITDYGYEAATKLSMGLSYGGAVVVSGLAVGVDGAAHRGALKAGGKTVAVAGCGLDINYPASHAELRRLIPKNGAIVSEYPPGTPGSRVTFPMRNRIIAGLCRGTLVVEAGEKSGALITASLAAEMGRDVFAVPGSIFSEFSVGANKLIRDGAKPVLAAPDVLEEYLGLDPQTITQTTAASRPQPPEPESLLPPARPGPVQGLTGPEQALCSALSKEPLGLETLALRLNMETRVLLAAMTALEIKGFARSLPGRRYIRA